MYSLKRNRYYINIKSRNFDFYNLCNITAGKIRTFDLNTSYLDSCICNIHREMKITAI